MRLIDTTTLKLVEFYDTNIPQYVILSHTWGSQEVSMHDLSTAPQFMLDHSEGYRKIKSCCEKAWSTLGIHYCWVDTCCIDKSSSAELSEAINSMFKWYSRAVICYAYLSDVSSKSFTDDTFTSDLSKSRWFTRGWTLQELLAPAEITFFNSDWVELGSKGNLRTWISPITGIDEHTLVHPASLFSASVAQRMSWAASRETTRIEDVAYCLMGIFNVNMPLLYGEGEKAFVRLQEEIIKESNDHSLLAWESDLVKDVDDWDTLGVLARHPCLFKDAGGIQSLPGEGNTMTMSNRGLQVHLPIVEHRDGRLSAIINCIPALSNDPDLEVPYQLAIPLHPTAFSDGSFGRLPGAPIELIPELELRYWRFHTVYLWKFHTTTPGSAKALPMNFEIWNSKKAGVYLRKSVCITKPITELTNYDVWTHSWRNYGEHALKTRLQFPPGRSDCLAAFHFTHVVDPSEGFVIVIESKRVRGHWFMDVVPCAKHTDLEKLMRDGFQNTGLDSRHTKVTLGHEIFHESKRIKVRVNYTRIGLWMRNGTLVTSNSGKVITTEDLTLNDRFERTGTKLEVEFYLPEDDAAMLYELEGVSRKGSGE
jgi:hypothetical protein